MREFETKIQIIAKFVKKRDSHSSWNLLEEHGAASSRDGKIGQATIAMQLSGSSWGDERRIAQFA